MNDWLAGGAAPGFLPGPGWLCAVGLFALLSHLVMHLFPGVRVRRLFAPASPWLWRFIRGNFSVAYTLGWGVVGVGGLGGWCFAMGVWPPPAWTLGGGSLWVTLVVPALLNAGRKTRLSRWRGRMLSLVIGALGTCGLWMTMQWAGMP